jgi:hypothetical protein
MTDLKLLIIKKRASASPGYEFELLYKNLPILRKNKLFICKVIYIN